MRFFILWVEISEKIQKTTSFLPDYTFKDTESSIGTSISGIIGCGITVAFLVGLGSVIKIKRKKEKVINE